MNALSVVNEVDRLAPNQYSQEQKLEWLGELEGKIHADVMLKTPEELETLEKVWKDQLAVRWPHSDLYVHWLLAKVHQADGELELYQNRMESFNASYQNYVNWYIRTYDPANTDGAVYQ
ncbi:hypothetical protein [Pseudoflavonifractor sp. An85]|uniref:hypothetical protein n=1 Tax=Pseudoflavonifractor sp. An85 TaxID=1965661 RepID=UPI000B3826F5|nr:hypothetical protein [Pseudoflavonifractor sp. An85]OUN19594.1 hypothetical protein B5G37_13510 [Pseudoflavonifractor sp. An85]